MMHFSGASMLDKAILAVSPQRGLSRIQARAEANILMNYDAASNGRRVKGWRAPATDADAASRRGRGTMRQRSRDMIRNAPFAKRAQSVITNNVVGSGITPSITGRSKKQADLAAAKILPFLQSTDLDKHRALNLSSMQTVVMNSVFESGEVLAIRHVRTNDGRALPLAVELVEVDHLNTVISDHDGNEVRDGIEFDADGVAVAYHLYEQHPGSASRKISIKTQRIPAEHVLHIRRIDRPGQMRGVPWLAPVMVTLGEMRDYQEAQILKQKISALLAGVIKPVDGQKLPKNAPGLEKMSPGALVYADQGQDVVFTNPPKVDDFDVVMRLGLCAIAMGIGITYESLSGDLSRVNYSSMRAGRLEMDKNIETWQEQIMIAQFCAGIGRWALDAYRLTQSKRLSPLEVSWTAQRRALIDPVKEIPSILAKIAGGLSSLSREQRAMGLDPDIIAQERKDDAARLDGLAAGMADQERQSVGMRAVIALMQLIAGDDPADFTGSLKGESEYERTD
ncbi:phage portal protein [Cribrihabitans pelagius]|uniref:phage portal protein n=1 Tax=Cribrihabitans pelagius TaxID=1765746 RepID=UPI003B5B691F